MLGRGAEWTYLRQFFILPELRRRRIGRAAMRWLVQNPWRDESRIRLDVLVGNTDGIAFWRSIGFQDYCFTMEMDTRYQDLQDET
jgi:ribosomal protein S18 acetylase RimI-like enzyme